MAVLGNTRRVYIVTGTTTLTYTWLTGEQTNNFNRTSEALEYSDKSTVWAQFIAGKRGATAEITVYTDDTTGEPQYNAIKALHNGSTVRVFIGVLNGSSPSQGDVFTAIVTAISDTNDTGSGASRTISLTATGEVSHYPSLS